MGQVYDRLMGRAPAGPEDHPTRFPGETRCGAGCADTEGYRCQYVDTAGTRCGWWCRNHTVFMEGQAWCRRHASVVKWLKPRKGATGTTIFDAPIDDRSPNLVESIVDMIDADVTGVLARSFEVHPDARVVTDDHVRPASIRAADVEPQVAHELSGPEGRQGAWERGWSVHSKVGYLARVLLRASATEPPVVHLYVNGRHVLRRVPDWITNREAGSDPEADRHAFAGAVIDCMVQHLGVGRERRRA